MSIKPLLEPESINNKSLDLYCNLFSSNQIETKNIIIEPGGDIDADIITANQELNVVTGNGNVNYVTPDVGQPNFSLHCDGVGGTYWSPDIGGGDGIVYSGPTPATVGAHVKISNTNGLLVDNSKVVEDLIDLDIGGLTIKNCEKIESNTINCTGNCDIGGIPKTTNTDYTDNKTLITKDYFDNNQPLAPTLQNVYNSSNPAIITTVTGNPFIVKNIDPVVQEILTVENNSNEKVLNVRNVDVSINKSLLLDGGFIMSNNIDTQKFEISRLTGQFKIDTYDSNTSLRLPFGIECADMTVTSSNQTNNIGSNLIQNVSANHTETIGANKIVTITGSNQISASSHIINGPLTFNNNVTHNQDISLNSNEIEQIKLIELNNQSVTPANPPANTHKVYTKTGSNSLYTLNSTGVETEIGGGGNTGPTVYKGIASVTATVYTDLNMSFTWNGTTRQLQFTMLTRPSGQWVDGGVQLTTKGFTNEFLTNVDDITTTLNTLQYFTDNGTRNTDFDLIQYGNIARYHLCPESSDPAYPTYIIDVVMGSNTGSITIIINVY